MGVPRNVSRDYVTVFQQFHFRDQHVRLFRVPRVQCIGNQVVLSQLQQLEGLYQAFVEDGVVVGGGQYDAFHVLLAVGHDDVEAVTSALEESVVEDGVVGVASVGRG